MPILQWNEKLEIGVKEIDNQHKKLVEMLNTAYEAIADQREQEVVPEMVRAMRRYALEHFLTEEELMEKHHYPDENDHRKQHNDFMAKAALSDSAANTNTIDPTELFRFLANWLSNHILKTDKALAEFLNEQGVY